MTRYHPRVFQCRECDALQKLGCHELPEFGAPRCVTCGGPLIETDDSRERLGLSSKSVSCRKGARRCAACGALTGTNQGLHEHLHAAVECAQYYHEEGKCWPYGEHWVIPETIVINHLRNPPASRPWAVRAVTAASVQVMLHERLASARDCEHWVKVNLGSEVRAL